MATLENGGAALEDGGAAVEDGGAALEDGGAALEDGGAALGQDRHHHVLEVEVAAPVQQVRAEMTDAEKADLAWAKFVMPACSTVVGTWNGIRAQKLSTDGAAANFSDPTFVAYNFWAYTIFSLLTNGSVYGPESMRPALSPRAVSFLALLHIYYAMFMMCYEGNRMAGTSWEILTPVLISLVIVITMIWSIRVSPEWMRRMVPHYQHMD